ncbi:MAG: PQQ-binding-like beta-propeller repeat protein [Planctomycetota bacterium]
MPHALVARLLCLTLALVVIGACSSRSASPDSPRPVRSNTGLLIAPEDAFSLGYRVGWATDLAIPRNHRIAGVKRLGDRLLVLEEPNTLVHAIDLASGNVEWTRQVGENIEELFGAFQTGNTIYILSDQQLWSLRAETGEVLGAQTLDHSVRADAVLQDDLIVAGAINGRVFGYSPQRGFAEWEYRLVDAIEAPIVADPPNVFATDSTGVYAMIDARDGGLRWRGRTFEGIEAAPAIDRLAVYVPSTDRSLYALDRTSGEDRWVYRSAHPLRLSPIVLGLTVYQPIREAGLVALSVRDGSELWTHDELLTPIVADDTTTLAFGSHGLVRLGVEDGAVYAEAKTPRLHQAMALDDGKVLMITPKGRLLTLNPINPPTNGGVAQAN